MLVTLDTVDTEYSADSVEWCPAEDFRDLFVCGSYQLLAGEETEGASGSSDQKRLGRIYLFKVIANGKLELLQTLNTSAILDMKWAHKEIHGKILLGVVNSIGWLQIYCLENETQPTLKLIAECKVHQDEEEVLALSLDWNTGRWNDESCHEVEIVVSDSKGSISLYKLDEEKLQLLGEKKVHEFEAWITAFDYWDPNIIYSGGDDCKFNRLDKRMELESTGGNRVHGAGVTSLHSNAQKEFSLASGSYDEILRLWDTRSLQRPISETILGGGVWRLKWDPFSHEKLLAACMYGGFRLIDCKNDSNPRIIEEYNEHESIAYGCDWSLLSKNTITTKILENRLETFCLIATCSFYDHTLKLSSLELPSD